MVQNRRSEPTPPLFGASQFRRYLWHQKNRASGLSYGIVCMILRLVVLVQ